MVKKVELHQCEICKRNYESEKDAINCELNGIEGDLLINIGDKLKYNVWSDIVDGKLERYFADIELFDHHQSHDNSYYFKYIDPELNDELDIVKVYGNKDMLSIIGNQ